MFKNLFQFWKEEDFLNEVIDKVKVMLEDSEGMYISACNRLIKNEDDSSIKDKLYAVDKQINELERQIRKRIIEHLTLQPTKDVSISLLVMSIVKDAERLGDYCKNLFEVTQLLDAPLDKVKYEELFDVLDADLLTLYAATKEAFIDSNEQKACSAWQVERGINRRCEDIIKQVARGTYATNEAVCFTLIARYFKRLAAHLTNIATSVILPLNELDYFDEKVLKEGETCSPEKTE